jgi:hypothetical protein
MHSLSRDIELGCLYRRGDASPILMAFLDVIRSSGEVGSGGTVGRERRSSARTQN